MEVILVCIIDRELLLEEADARTVAEYLGMEVVRKGAHDFICCPGHEKRLGRPDTNISNCILTDKGYRCFACNKSVNIIDMTMEFTGCSYPEALNMIADACGGSALYKTDGKISKDITPKIMLSAYDLSILGLKPEKTEYPILNASDVPFEAEEDDEACKMVNGEYLLCKRQHHSLNQMYKDNRLGYNYLVLSKANEAMKKYERALADFCSKDAAKADLIFELFNQDGYLDPSIMFELKNIFQKRYTRAKEIYDSMKAEIDEHQKK